MNVITIESEAFELVIKRLDEIQGTLDERNKEPKEKWLENQEIIQLLKISKRTAQHYWDSGMI